MLDVLTRQWLQEAMSRSAREVSRGLRRAEHQRELDAFKHRWDGYKVEHGEVKEAHPQAGVFGRTVEERDASGRESHPFAWRDI